MLHAYYGQNIIDYFIFISILTSIVGIFVMDFVVATPYLISNEKYLKRETIHQFYILFSSILIEIHPNQVTN